MEALPLAQAGYPCPPDTRPPHGWVLSAGEVPVPPVPLVGSAAFAREVDAVRAQMTAAERANPENAPNNTLICPKCIYNFCLLHACFV